MSSRSVCFLLLLMFAASPVIAQNPEPSSTAPIQDNSFLIEEAYNQEPGVIQHISTLTRLWASKQWVFSFTEEWPLPGHAKNQISYTMNVTDPNASFSAGVGDSLFNYRYQLIGNGASRLALAPRVSLIAPTGNAAMSRGYGGFGLQTNIPLSVTVSRHLVTHWNAGLTIVPSAANATGQRAFSSGYNLGQSFIWLLSPRVNALVENCWTSGGAVVAENTTRKVNSMYINPGIRWAYNLKSGMQIVPGVGVPIGVGPSAKDHGLFLYLSVEHPLALISRPH